VRYRAQPGKEAAFGRGRVTLVELEAQIAAEQRLALVGDAGGDRLRHRIDAAYCRDPKRDAGEEDQEAGQPATHLAQ
jgi:hypothetical protein